jgi:hypothetical protein
MHAGSQCSRTVCKVDKRILLLVAALTVAAGNAAAVQKGVEIWNYTAPDRINAIALLNGSTILGCEDNFIYALNGRGNVLWTYQTGGSVKALDASDGSIIAGSMDGFIYSLDKDGGLQWMRHLPAYVGYPDAIHQQGERIVAGSINGVVYAFSMNGVALWEFKTDSYVMSTRIVNGVVIAVSDKKVYFLDSAGVLQKSFDAGTYITSDGVSDDYIALTIEGNKLLVLDTDGNPLWNYTEKDFFGPIYIANDSITVGSRNGTMYSFGMDGALKWKQDLEKSVVSVYATSGYVTGSSLTHVLYVYDPKGTVKGIYGLDKYATVIAGGKDTLIAGTSGGEVHAIQFVNQNPLVSNFAAVIVVIVILSALLLLARSWSY